MWVCLAGCLLLAVAAADADSAGCFSLLLLTLLLLTKLRLGRAADSSGLHRDFLVSYDKLPWTLWPVLDKSFGFRRKLLEKRWSSLFHKPKTELLGPPAHRSCC